MNNLREIIFEKIASFFVIIANAELRTYYWCMRIFVWIACGVLCGCAKKNPEVAFPDKGFDQQSPGRVELEIFGPIGFWKQSNEFVSVYGETNKTISFLRTHWKLNGHYLIEESETKISEGKKKPSLKVKFYNEFDSTEPYRCVWFQDNGSLMVFSGAYGAKSKQIKWKSIDAFSEPGVKLRIEEAMLADEVQSIIYELNSQIVGQPLLKGSSTKLKIPDPVQSREKVKPIPELARLGMKGMWKENQIIQVSGKQISLEGVSRMDWAQGGEALIIETTVETEKGNENSMWIKKWDREKKVYRAFVFNEDSPMFQYIGEWDSADNSIRWVDRGRSGLVELVERFPESGKRTWKISQSANNGNTTVSGNSAFIYKN